jgi:hypothetical protein
MELRVLQGLAFYLILSAPLYIHADEIGLKPGDTIGPENWKRVEGMVGENLLNRIKAGYTFKIKEHTIDKPPIHYIQATNMYSGRVSLDWNGGLRDYVAGLPFPKIDSRDPQAGLKLAWNLYWRWRGDDHTSGEGVGSRKIISDAVERDGSERRSNLVVYYLKPRGRITLDPKPAIPGYEHIDWMQLRADEYPRDTSGSTTLEIRYRDPRIEDDLYIYIPSLRRVHRAPPIQRCATLAPTEFNFDDINSFNGKITNFNYRFLGEKRMLGNSSQEHAPFRRQRGDYLPLDESWEVVDTYVLEITPKDPSYCYPKKLIYMDKVAFENVWTMIWDGKGNYWKEQFGFRTPVSLADGQKVLSVGSVVVVNLQNGRSTVLTAVRSFDQGYRPTLFTLATLQTVMRGGSIR